MPWLAFPPHRRPAGAADSLATVWFPYPPPLPSVRRTRAGPKFKFRPWWPPPAASRSREAPRPRHSASGDDAAGRMRPPASLAPPPVSPYSSGRFVRAQKKTARGVGG